MNLRFDMQFYTGYAVSTGEVLSEIYGVGIIPPEDTGHTKYILGNYPGSQYYIDSNGVPVAYSVEQGEAKALRPSLPSRWDNAQMQWVSVLTLDNLKAEKWESIKLERETRETGTFQWNGHTIDADKARINGAALSVMIAQAAGYAHSDVWTLADNSKIPVTGQDILAMGLALAAHVSACRARARTLRELIEATTTTEQVVALTWETPA